MRSQSKYISNVGILKKFSEKNYKLTVCFSLRNGGYEEEKKFVAKGSAGNVEKLEESIIRAKSRIVEISLCNPWDYFVTLTLNKEKFDRYNLKGYVKALGKFLNNYNERKLHGKEPIRYLLIPEQHEDGAWHLHGFIQGLPESHLCRNNNGYWDWQAYSEKFGFMSLDYIKDKEKCANYILKYISKGFEENNIGLESHLYYCSKGLKRAEVIYKDVVTKPTTEAEGFYKNDYVAIKNFENIEQPLEFFKED